MTSVAGFSYGAIGASIHVFGDGVPVYVLLNWQPGSGMDAGWLCSMPSRMLNARFAVVPFTGRDEAVAELVQWRDGPARSAVRWLHAEGGSGKTRLAAKLAGGSAADGWKVVTAVPGPGTVLPQPGSQDLRADGAPGILVLIDYAEQWPQTHLTWLLSNDLITGAAQPVRVLLVARAAGPPATLREELARRRIDVSAQRLPELRASADSEDTDWAAQADSRLSMFEAARTAFAARYGIADPAAIAPSVPLDDPGMGLTLAVHMAALVAVDAYHCGEPAPGDLSGLTLYLLDRECLRWERMRGDDRHEIAPAERTYRSAAPAIHRVAFAAALTGRLPHDLGITLVGEIGAVPAGAGPDEAEQVLADHRLCYPPADGTSATVFEPLYPDRLAEDFLALTLPGHGVAFAAQPWARDVLAVVLRRADADLRPERWTSRALSLLIAAAARWEHVGSQHLYRLLDRDPRLAVDGGSAALSGLAGLPDVPTGLLTAVVNEIGRVRQPDLQTDTADIVERLAPYRLRRVLVPGARAEVLGELARYLMEARKYGKAAGALDQAVAITRRQASPNGVVRLNRRLLGVDTSDIQLKLVGMLTTLAGLLNATNEPDRAIAAAQESLAIIGVLGEPEDFTPERTAALGALSSAYSRLGRDQDAVEIARQTVELRREQGQQYPFHIYPWLAQMPGISDSDIARHRAIADPDGHERGLAEALITLGSRKSMTGDHEEAVTSLREAIELLKPLAQGNAGRPDLELARAYEIYGSILTEAGHFTEAASAAEAAVTGLRTLARANSALNEPHLALALGHLSRRRWKLGQLDSAIETAEEGCQLRERHRASAMDAGRVCQERAELAGLYTAAGRHDRALATAERAVVGLRALAGQLPQLDLSTMLADALTKLAEVSYAAGGYERALAADSESLELRSQVAEGASSPSALSSLAIGLGNRSGSLAGLGRNDEALVAAAQALQIFREIAAAQPEAYEPDVARTLGNTVGMFRGLGRHDEALAAARESVQLYRHHAAQEWRAHGPSLARVLDELDGVLYDLGRYAEAAAALEEAAAIYRRLQPIQPHVHDAALVHVLKHLARRLRRLGKLEQALKVTWQAISLGRELPGSQPELADTLSDLGVLLTDLERPESALAATSESADLYRELVLTDPSQLVSLCGELRRLAARQRALGQDNDATVTAQEAIARCREAIDRIRPDDSAERVEALRTLGATAAELGLAEESLAALEEAVALLLPLTESDPVKWEPDLAMTLADLASPLTKLERLTDAPASTLEALAIYERLATRNSAEITEQANVARNNLKALDAALANDSAPRPP